MDIFNVIGRKELVDELAQNHIVVDRFPAKPGEADFNIKTADNEASDVLVQFCEDNNLHCELVV